VELGTLIDCQERAANWKEGGRMESDEAVYEPPMLAEVGVFTELTRGFGFDSIDAFDFFSGFFWW
jgi:hypothetical protein